MAKQKPRPKAPNATTLFLRLDPETAAALVAYVAAQTVPPERTAVATTALRRFLREQGYLPK